MSRLHDALDDYLTVRRAMGYTLVRTGGLLAQFVDYRVFPKSLRVHPNFHHFAGRDHFQLNPHRSLR